jgi:hypothetical protein
MLVGFAAETDDVVAGARRKQREKGIDLVVANDVSRTDIGFEVDANEVTLVTPSGEETLPRQTKSAIALQIVQRIETLLLRRYRRPDAMTISRDALAEHLKLFEELASPGTARIRRGRRGRSRKSLGSPRPQVRLPQRVVRTEDGTGPLDYARDRQPGDRTRSTGHETANESTPFATLAAIREDIGDCTRCKLCRLGRKQIVFGVGSPTADLMFVGEAPGRDEDIQGIPFVGRAGQKLTQIIEAIGLKRDDVYIANVIKCRPPENRNPEPTKWRSASRSCFVRSIRSSRRSSWRSARSRRARS